MSDLIKSAITESAIGGELKESVFGKIRKSYIDSGDIDKWMSECDTSENEWCYDMFKDKEGCRKYEVTKTVKGNVTTKNVATEESLRKHIEQGWTQTGNYVWKKRTLLPTDYTVAKNAIKTAVEAGVEVTESMSKSEIDKKKKELKEEEPRSKSTQLLARLEWIEKNWPHFDDGDRAMVITRLSALPI